MYSYVYYISPSWKTLPCPRPVALWRDSRKKNTRNPKPARPGLRTRSAGSRAHMPSQAVPAPAPAWLKRQEALTASFQRCHASDGMWPARC